MPHPTPEQIAQAKAVVKKCQGYFEDPYLAGKFASFVKGDANGKEIVDLAAVALEEQPGAEWPHVLFGTGGHFDLLVQHLEKGLPFNQLFISACPPGRKPLAAWNQDAPWSEREGLKGADDRAIQWLQRKAQQERNMGAKAKPSQPYFQLSASLYELERSTVGTQEGDAVSDSLSTLVSGGTACSGVVLEDKGKSRAKSEISAAGTIQDFSRQWGETFSALSTDEQNYLTWRVSQYAKSLASQTTQQ